MALKVITAVLVVLVGAVVAQFQQDANFDSTRYVAAERGSKPNCRLGPGGTYCENIDGYPTERILYAIANTPGNIAKFLVDESLDNGPNFDENGFLIPSGSVGLDTPEIPAPYPPSSFPQKTETQSANIPRPVGQYPSAESSPLFLNRFNPTKTDRVQQGVPCQNGTGTTVQLKIRTKRESLEPDVPLCPAKLVYIYPRVSMSVKSGMWMYLVNMRLPGMTQLLRSEICMEGIIGQSCMGGHCDTPFGIVSKCEQHYLQRRLVSLAEDGSRVVADMFWIPSCCVCRSYRSTGDFS